MKCYKLKNTTLGSTAVIIVPAEDFKTDLSGLSLQRKENELAWIQGSLSEIRDDIRSHFTQWLEKVMEVKDGDTTPSSLHARYQAFTASDRFADLVAGVLKKFRKGSVGGRGLTSDSLVFLPLWKNFMMAERSSLLRNLVPHALKEAESGA